MHLAPEGESFAEVLDMTRNITTLIAIAGALTLTAVRADARIIYGGPALALTPVVVADRDDRYAGAYDVQGVVTSFDRFNMTLRVDGRQFPVVLHQGTVIHPTGTTLAPSMIVNIDGYWQNGAFFANKISVVRY
jgi:hypothetical protein